MIKSGQALEEQRLKESVLKVSLGAVLKELKELDFRLTRENKKFL